MLMTISLGRQMISPFLNRFSVFGIPRLLHTNSSKLYHVLPPMSILFLAKSLRRWHTKAEKEVEV